MTNQHLVSKESGDSGRLKLIAIGFGLTLAVAIVASNSRAQAAEPAAESMVAAKTIAAGTQQADSSPVERRNEMARADVPVVRLPPLVIIATRSEIAAARAAQLGELPSNTSGAIAANAAASAR